MEKTRELPEKSEEMITISRAEYEALQAKLSTKEEELTAALLKNQWLLEQLRLNRKKQYGPSSEQLDQLVFEQFGRVFNEAEAWCAGVGKKETQVKAHTRKPRSGSMEEVVPEGTPVEVVEHRPEDRSCPKCGSEMVEIGKEVRRTLKMEPARFWIQEDVYYTYACKVCEKETGDSVIVNTPKEPAVLPGSFASPEAIAHLMVQKFVMYSPLYRQEQEWGRQGLRLSRQVMSHWLLRAAEDWLAPIYQELHKELVGRDVLHGDETTLQVLKEPGKSAQSKSYMWLYRTGGDAEHPIVLYDYRPDRKAKNAEEFLEGFSGYLHADGYQGYHKLGYKCPQKVKNAGGAPQNPGENRRSKAACATCPPQVRPNIRVAGCWAHARRKFDEAVKSLPQKEQAGCAALEGQAFCTKLFAIEAEIQDLSLEEKRKQRQSRAKPVLNALFSWAEEKLKVTPPKSALGKALHYLKEQWPYLIRYLEDGRLEVSNNRAERSIKPFVMGRKNWLFANTPAGAQASAVIYSLIETAKETGLDPYKYLLWVLQEAPKLFETDREWAKKLTPEHCTQH